MGRSKGGGGRRENPGERIDAQSALRDQIDEVMEIPNPPLSLAFSLAAHHPFFRVVFPTLL